VNNRASYPCVYSLPNVICVAAIDSAGRLASFSNFGSTKVHLAAPGVAIKSTVPVNGYDSYSGGRLTSAPLLPPTHVASNMANDGKLQTVVVC
jgi:hypothetical protein